jgi:hypothetical protein
MGGMKDEKTLRMRVTSSLLLPMPQDVGLFNHCPRSALGR